MYKVLITLILVLLNIYQIKCSLPKCTYRSENVDLIREANPRLSNCTYVKELHPICRDPITVIYAEEPPYVISPKPGFSGTPTGLLPDILNYTFFTCCFGCKKLIFQPSDHFEKFNTEMRADVLMPVQSSTKSIEFNGIDFVSLVKASKVLILAKQRTEKVKETELTKLMFNAVIKTWPLFVIALLMAFTAGCFIWVLDTWFNEDHFTRRFPKGIADGFWWAFVTMTTVGYGDKTPTSFNARLFSIFWIFLGITMFNMYTAVLTSVIDVKASVFDVEDLADVNIGVLKSSSLGSSAVLQEKGNDIQYDSVYHLADALEKDEIKAISIDAYKASYYMDEFQEHVPLIKTHHSVENIDHAYGVLSKHGNLTSFINSFFLTNDDHKQSMVSYAMRKQFPNRRLIEEVVPKADFFNSNSPMFRYTIIGLLMISFVLILLGLVFRQYFNRNKNVLTRYVDLMNGKFDMCNFNKVNAQHSPKKDSNKIIADCVIDLDNFVNKWKAQLNDLKMKEENRVALVTT